jgi:hypothetical protein
MDFEKIDYLHIIYTYLTYFLENKQILWKRNLDFSLTPWVRNAEIINNFCHFKGPWNRAHNLKLRNKMLIHAEAVNQNIIDLIACKAITVLGDFKDEKVLNYCQCISPLHVVEEYRFDPVIKANKMRLRI